jgi:hypothetical protein
MKQNFIVNGLIALILLLQSCRANKNLQENNLNHIWTFTYLKALDNQKANLETYIEKNWFVMDSIAVNKKLIGRYELYENEDPENKEWDFIVAVEYLTPKGYEAIATDFEAIRVKHQIVRVNGLGMMELGKIVKSETVSRKSYPR